MFSISQLCLLARTQTFVTRFEGVVERSTNRLRSQQSHNCRQSTFSSCVWARTTAHSADAAWDYGRTTIEYTAHEFEHTYNFAHTSSCRNSYLHGGHMEVPLFPNMSSSCLSIQPCMSSIRVGPATFNNFPSKKRTINISHCSTIP